MAITGKIEDTASWYLNEISEFREAVYISDKVLEALDVLSFHIHLLDKIDLSVDITDVLLFCQLNTCELETVFNLWLLQKQSKYGYSEWRTMDNFMKVISKNQIVIQSIEYDTNSLSEDILISMTVKGQQVMMFASEEQAKKLRMLSNINTF